MLETHINRVIEHCNQYISDKEFYFLSDLKVIDKLPNFIFRYINNFATEKIAADLNQIRSINCYDFSDEASFEQLLILEKHLISRFFLSREQVKIICQDVVKLHFNYLLRPRNTLLKTYSDREFIEVDAVIQKFSYFSNYTYLTNEVLRDITDFINEKNTISYKELSNLVDKVDSDYIFSKSAGELISLLSPVFGIFELYQEDTGERIVPIEAIMIFFDDKNLLPIVELLDTKYRTENLFFISEQKLLGVLLEVLDSVDNNTRAVSFNVTTEQDLTKHASWSQDFEDDSFDKSVLINSGELEHEVTNEEIDSNLKNLGELFDVENVQVDFDKWATTNDSQDILDLNELEKLLDT